MVLLVVAFLCAAVSHRFHFQTAGGARHLFRPLFLASVRVGRVVIPLVVEVAPRIPRCARCFPPWAPIGYPLQSSSGGRLVVGRGHWNFLEIQPGSLTVEVASRFVVRQSCFLGGGERAEPNPGLNSRLANLGDPLAPCPLPHAAEDVQRVLRAALLSFA